MYTIIATIGYSNDYILNKLNNYSEKIKFANEMEEQNKIPFLNTLMFRNNYGILKTN